MSEKKTNPNRAPGLRNISSGPSPPGLSSRSGPATDWMLGPRGVHSGVLAVLADGALIGSVISGFPPVFSSHTHPTSHAAPSTPRARV